MQGWKSQLYPIPVNASAGGYLQGLGLLQTQPKAAAKAPSALKQKVCEIVSFSGQLYNA
jgi:hypothetical protein